MSYHHTVGTCVRYARIVGTKCTLIARNVGSVMVVNIRRIEINDHLNNSFELASVS